jgi:peptidyl-prolyl cis-trans isomerase B (cyclophilin B)
MTRILLVLVGLVALVAGSAGAQTPAPKPAAPPAGKAKASPTALITMEKGGEVVLELFPQDAPKHVENFVKLVSQKFYDGQRVHRVEPKFVVQFGDPQSKTLPLDDPRMGSGGPGYTIKAEFNKRPFERGVLGMARTDDPNSAGSQVYIMLGPAAFLNGKYTAFGRVVTGMGVVDQIRVGDRIKSIKIVTK